jgi:hypothetical protein
MSDDTAYLTERVIAHITAYLSANPYAADTIAGIQRWWLSSGPCEVDNGNVERAIEVMLRRGILECRSLPDGTRIFARPWGRGSQKIIRL